MIGVTSFSAEGYKKYGHHFLKFIDNWPGKIILYLEEPIDFEHEKLEKRDFFGIVGVNSFLENIKDIPKAHGMGGPFYNYNFDLNKFCRKMFCQFDAFKEGGKIYWLDADLEFKKQIPEDLLINLFKDRSLVFMGREGLYTECGVVGFDTEHEEFEIFEKRYKATLQKGLVFGLKKGWHDCYCFDWAKGRMGNNLTPNWKKGESLDVLSKTKLGKYMVHHKGNRKNKLCH